jgi:hypothetical protein
MPCARCNAPMPPGPFRLHCKRCAPARGRLSLAPPRPQPQERPAQFTPRAASNIEHIEHRNQGGTKRLNGLEGISLHIRDADVPSPTWQLWLGCNCSGEGVAELPAPPKPKKPPRRDEWLKYAPSCPKCGSRKWDGPRETYLLVPK